MKKLLAIIVFLLVYKTQTHTLMAEEPETAKPYRIGISLGGSFVGYRDEIDTPINRYLNSLTYLLDGNIEQGNFFHSFNFCFYMGEAHVAQRYREFHQDYAYQTYSGYAEYALDYRLWGNETFPGFLGSNFRAIVHYVYDTSGEMDVPKLTEVFSLGLHATQKWIIDQKHSLVFSASIPLFAYAIRSPYAGTDELWQKYAADDTIGKIFWLGEFASVHNYWAIVGDLKYHYKIIPLLSLYGGLGFELSHIDFPKPKKDAIFRINAGIAFVF